MTNKIHSRGAETHRCHAYLDLSTSSISVSRSGNSSSPLGRSYLPAYSRPIDILGPCYLQTSAEARNLSIFEVHFLSARSLIVKPQIFAVSCETIRSWTSDTVFESSLASSGVDRSILVIYCWSFSYALLHFLCNWLGPWRWVINICISFSKFRFWK